MGSYVSTEVQGQNCWDEGQGRFCLCQKPFNLRLKGTSVSNSLTSLPDKDPFLKGPKRPLLRHGNDMYGRYGIWKDKHHGKGQVRRGKAKARRSLRSRERNTQGRGMKLLSLDQNLSFLCDLGALRKGYK